MLRKFPFLFLLFANFVFAEPDYQLIGDIDMSPYAGGEDLISVQHYLKEGEDWVLKRPPTEKSWGRGVGRFFELIAWDIVNTYLMVTQHEIFGHGYRIRDLGRHYAKVSGYEFNWDGAVTKFHISENLTIPQMTTITIGGVEATAILANRLRFKFLENGRIDGRDSALYLQSEQDLTHYIYSMKNILEPSPGGHDISSYLFYLNSTYPKGYLTKDRLQILAVLNVLDPFTFYAYYAWGKFIVDGKPMHIPMIRIKDYKYLPSARLGLTPFGPEYFLENFLVKDRKPIYFYLKWGSFADNNYFGFGIEQPYLFSKDWLFLGYRFDAWYQPKVLSQKGAIQAFNLEENPSLSRVIFPYPQSLLDRKIPGASLSLLFEARLRDKCYFYLEPGFKTKGFLPGQALRASPIFRGGFSLHF